jgi:hypothetical protein
MYLYVREQHNIHARNMILNTVFSGGSRLSIRGAVFFIYKNRISKQFGFKKIQNIPRRKFKVKNTKHGKIKNDKD